MSDPATDYAITFEKPYTDWIKHYWADQNSNHPASWWTSSSYSGKLAHVIYSDGTNPTQLDVSSAVSTSRGSTYGSPVLYLYDGTSSSYGHLSCFFESEVAALQNQSPVSGKTYCSGSCTDVSSDTNNCGTCGDVCNAGYGCCSASCHNVTNDIHNCGACGHNCNAPTHGVATCTASTCGIVCSYGYHTCDDRTCIPTSTQCP